VGLGRCDVVDVCMMLSFVCVCCVLLIHFQIQSYKKYQKDTVRYCGVYTCLYIDSKCTCHHKNKTATEYYAGNGATKVFLMGKESYLGKH
jgi:hypothetical protein